MVELLREGAGRRRGRPVSSGVFYATGAAADVDELALLAGIAGAAGGVYTTHIRQRDGQGPRFARRGLRDRAARPACRWSSRITSAPGPRNWGRTVRDAGRTSTRARRGQPIGLDCYPYIAGSTVLRSDLVDGIIDIIITWSTPHPEMAARHARRASPHEWGCSAEGGVRAPAARRRVLLPDARGRRRSACCAIRRR